MKLYAIECRGDAREVYHVEARDEDHVRELWESGDFPEPTVVECSTDIEHITEES